MKLYESKFCLYLIDKLEQPKQCCYKNTTCNSQCIAFMITYGEHGTTFSLECAISNHQIDFDVESDNPIDISKYM